MNIVTTLKALRYNNPHTCYSYFHIPVTGHRYSGDEIKENEMGGACGTYEGAEKYIPVCVGRNLKEREYLENQGVDMRVILKYI
jgi:hypothetical protein